MKVNIKKLPEGYKIVDGKLIKQMQKGGPTNKTLQQLQEKMQMLKLKKMKQF